MSINDLKSTIIYKYIGPRVRSGRGLLRNLVSLYHNNLYKDEKLVRPKIRIFRNMRKKKGYVSNDKLEYDGGGV